MAATLNAPSIAESHLTSLIDYDSVARDNQYGANIPDPASLLVEKIASALKHEGYDHYSIERVKKLVVKNSYTDYYSGGVPDAKDAEIASRDWTPATEAAAICAKYMQQPGRCQTLNSNELVLLLMVNRLIDFSVDEVKALGRAVVSQFQDKYGIRPVRMYVGGLVLDDREYIDETGLELAATILNVCNTDIGSPSMIQLLDHGAESALWQEHVFSSTAYNGTDLSWQWDRSWHRENSTAEQQGRADVESVDAERVTPASEEVSANLSSGELHDQDIEPEMIAEISPSSPGEVSKPNVDEDSIASETPERSTTPVQHPALIELAERESKRPTIAHPTWDHPDHESSLVDLVMSHASQTPHSDESSDEAEIVQAQDRAHTRKAPSDDEFEIV